MQAQAVPRAERRVSVIVKLAADFLAAYKGDVSGLAATSPAATGAATLDATSSASRQYLTYLGQRQRAFATAASSISGAEIRQRFDVVLGGVAMLVPESQLAALRAMPGVKAVYLDQLLQLDTNVSPQFIGAPVIWKALGGQGKAGEGVVVGVLDFRRLARASVLCRSRPGGKQLSAPAADLDGDGVPVRQHGLQPG